LSTQYYVKNDAGDLLPVDAVRKETAEEMMVEIIRRSAPCAHLFHSGEGMLDVVKQSMNEVVKEFFPHSASGNWPYGLGVWGPANQGENVG